MRTNKAISFIKSISIRAGKSIKFERKININGNKDIIPILIAVGLFED